MSSSVHELAVGASGGGATAFTANETTTTPQLQQQQPPSQAHLIPLYFRVVPKDLWVRMHVDVRSTIGAVKDALLERLDMPPHDPSLSTGFYDEAKTAMSRQGASPSEARAFPKAFVARTPKQSVRDVLLAEREAKEATGVGSSRMAKSAQSRFRSVPAAEQARAILGGDMGVGGRGSMGFMSVYARHPEMQGNVQSTFSRKDTISKQQQQQQQPVQAIVNSTPRRRNRPDPHSEARASTPATDRPTPDADLDTYMNYFGGGLPGNEEAKRSEEAAMAALLALDAGAGYGTEIPASSPAIDRLDLPNADPLVDQSPRAPSARIDDEDEALDDELIEGDMAYKELVARSRSISLHSLSSSESLGSKEAPFNVATANSAPSSAGEHSQRSAHIPSAVGSSSPTSSKGERARSGTIMQNDVRRIKAATSVPRSSTSSTGHTQSSSSDTPAVLAVEDDSRQPLGAAGRSTPTTPPVLRTTAEPLLSVQSTPSAFSDHDGLRLKSSVTRLAAQGNLARRLAGIHPDEISSWKEAQHGQARYYSLYSFSNGHLLEDWRTVAAFRIRPYELLEVHFADRRDKVHLPRIGEAIELSRKTAPPSKNRDDQNATGSASLPWPQANPAFDMQYLDWFCEGWCYIYKHGGGTSKAQRAGLGLWKLRYVSLRGTNLFVFRRKEARTAVEQMYNMWSLEAVETIISERADGVTRPKLMPLAGLCQDTLTLTFVPIRSQALIDGGVGQVFRQPPLSMRFITQIDHYAFFKACARAHHHSALLQSDLPRAAQAVEWRTKALARATIAGRGGTVLPGKAARRAGRNALARARLRPAGISREFDDADRWSSDSEGEAIVVNGGATGPVSDTMESAEDSGSSTRAFTYSDAAVQSLSTTVDAPTSSPALFNPHGGELAASSSLPGPDTPLSPETAYFDHPPLEASPTGSSKFGLAHRSADSASRRRGFTLGHLRYEGVGGEGQGSGDLPGGNTSGRGSGGGLAARLFASPPASARVGLGVTADPSSPSAFTSSSSVLQSSPTRASSTGRAASHILTDELDGGSRASVLALRSPGVETRGASRASPSSPFGGAGGATTSDVPVYAASLAQQPSPYSPVQRPIASPPTAEEEQSPAAQAIHSFLAAQRRSLSSASGVNRARSNTTSNSMHALRRNNVSGIHDDRNADEEDGDVFSDPLSRRPAGDRGHAPSWSSPTSPISMQALPSTVSNTHFPQDNAHRSNP